MQSLPSGYSNGEKLPNESNFNSALHKKEGFLLFAAKVPSFREIIFRL